MTWRQIRERGGRTGRGSEGTRFGQDSSTFGNVAGESRAFLSDALPGAMLRRATPLILEGDYVIGSEIWFGGVRLTMGN